jgi:hypothetical protein
MINLIPPAVRKAIVKEYWVRVTSVFLCIAAGVALTSILFLSPVYVLISSQVDVFAQTANEAAMRVAEYDVSAAALVEANGMAQKIVDLREVDKFSTAVELLESLQGATIELDGFEFGRSLDGSLAPVEVTGEAATRQALADFRDRLLADKTVAEVNLPISNLAKDKNIQFSLSVVFKDAE